ncbi:hypothetical protein OIU78_026156 [Salix suchowensis]|nr:hypothetical protein OIU78_026156 [Salix suchowensis]
MVAAITISCPKSTVLQNPTSLKDPCSSFFGGSLKGVPFQLKPGNKRLDSFSLVVAAASNTPTTTSTSSSSGGGGRFYLNFTGFPFPLGPFLNRRTIRTEAVKGCIWLFEQEQALGFSSVSTNIRMTVIKLKSGGLWVHAPIAPTEECIQLLKELGAPVEYIVLPTFAYEHKIFVVLSSPEVGIGPYVEVAFYHKRSRSLLVTDAVIFVARKPPECIGKESLLASAKNGLAVKILSKGKEVPQEPVVDNQMSRQKGLGKNGPPDLVSWSI